jgi:chromosome segregation ATPase
MEFKKNLLTSSIGKDKIISVLFCLLMFSSGCFDDLGKISEEQRSSESDNNKSKKLEVMMPKALHDDLMSEQETRWQELNLKLEFVSRHLQNLQTEQDKLLVHLAEFNALKLELATTQEELKRITAETDGYKTSSQAATSAKSAAHAQTIRQLTASNSQLSDDLATSKQQVGKLKLSVSRIQNPANMLRIRQLTLETTYLSKELAGREQKIQELQISLNSSRPQDNLNTVRQLKSQNTLLSESLARTERRLKDTQSLQGKPRNQVDSNLIGQLKSKNATLSTELDKLKQQLAQLATRPKDNVKTLAEWKTKLRTQGLMNILPTPAQIAASIGKPHDKEDRIPSGAGDEAIFIWRDFVKVDLEIHTIDGKIETITYDK